MRFLRENSLSLVLLTLFTLAMLGQACAGWCSDDDTSGLHHQILGDAEGLSRIWCVRLGNVRKLGE